VISVVGGVLASVVVLVSTVALAAVAVRREWDPDNVLAPLITAFGDLVTLPALYLATFLVGGGLRGPTMALVGTAAAVVAVIVTVRAEGTLMRSIVVESGPFVLVAGGLSLVAGVTLEGQLDALSEFPALLTLIPPFLAMAGSLGGILSNRLTTKLHLGVIPPSAVPVREARSDIGRVFLLAVPIFAATSLVGDLSSVLIDLRSPGALELAGVTVIGGLLVTTFAAVVAYLAAVASYRAGLDPDNVGIPMVTSSIDLVGSLSFVLAVAAVGVS
jgi:mgtE-like transporter